MGLFDASFTDLPFCTIGHLIMRIKVFYFKEGTGAATTAKLEQF